MSSDLIDSYCGEYHEYNNISAQRRHMQLRVLRDFEQSVGELADVNDELLRAYLATLVTLGLKPSTIEQRMTAIRPFLKWMWQRRIIDADALMRLKDVRGPRVAEGVPRPYARKQIKLMWVALDSAFPWARSGLGEDGGKRSLTRWRNGTSSWGRVEPYFKRVQLEAIISLALCGGIRREEIFRLTLDGLDEENEHIPVIGAAKNPTATPRLRGVPWQPMMLDAVQRWLRLREDLDVDHDRPWLSLSTTVHYRKPLQRRTFNMLLTRVPMHGGGNLEYHRLRHTFATEQLRAGLPLENLKEILGHTDIKQTLRYAQLLSEDNVRASAKASADFSRAVGKRPPPKL